MAIVDKKRAKRSDSFASMTAMQNFQPKDKQRAMEEVIEQKEKKLKDDESGKEKKQKGAT